MSNNIDFDRLLMAYDLIIQRDPDDIDLIQDIVDFLEEESFCMDSDEEVDCFYEGE